MVHKSIDDSTDPLEMIGRFRERKVYVSLRDLLLDIDRCVSSRLIRAAEPLLIFSDKLTVRYLIG